MSGVPNVWVPNVPDRKMSGRKMSGAGNVPTAYCLGRQMSREPNFRAPNVPAPIVGRGLAGAKCTTTSNIGLLYVNGKPLKSPFGICLQNPDAGKPGSGKSEQPGTKF